VAVAVPRGPEPGGAADGGRPWGPACAGTAQAVHCGGAPLSFCLRVWKRADVDRVLRAPSAPDPAVPVGLSRVFAASGGIGPERLRAFAPSAARAWGPALLPPVPGDYSPGRPDGARPPPRLVNLNSPLPGRPPREFNDGPSRSRPRPLRPRRAVGRNRRAATRRRLGGAPAVGRVPPRTAPAGDL